jgi:hypothetical protein
MYLPDYNYVLCHLNIEESLHHLFLECPFAMSCWNMLSLAQLIQGNLLNTIPLFKNQIHRPFFMEIIAAMFWGIWSVLNDVIFRNQNHSLQAFKLVFKQELAWIKLRAKRDLSLQLQLWLDNFV